VASFPDGRAGTLTPRDWLVARHVYACDLLSTPQVALLCFRDGYDPARRIVVPEAHPDGSEGAAKQRLNTLRREKSFLRSEHVAGVGTVWRLAAATHNALKPAGSAQRPPSPMTPQNTRHHLAVTDLYARVVSHLWRVGGAGLAGRFVWTCERRSYRESYGPGRSKVCVRPDATVWIGEDLFFVERETRHRKAPPEVFRRRVANYAEYLHLASPEERRATLLFACDERRDVEAALRAGEEASAGHGPVYVVAGTPHEIARFLIEEAMAGQLGRDERYALAT